VGRESTVLALGLEPAALALLRPELEAVGMQLVAASAPDAAAFAGADVLLLGEPGWRERMAEAHVARAELAVVLLTGDPQSLWVSGALRNRRLFQVVRGDHRAGELAAACLAAREATQLRRDLAEQRRLAQHRVEVMATLHEMTAATADLGSYAEVLEVITRDLHRLAPFDLVAVLAAVDPSGAVLHLHCQEPCDVTLVRAVRDRCLE
jgi:hypothetical protein